MKIYRHNGEKNTDIGMECAPENERFIGVLIFLFACLCVVLYFI